MHFSIPYLLITAVLNIILGLLVYLRNPWRLTSKSFGVLALAVALWCMGMVGFYSYGDIDGTTTSVEIFYVAALLMNTSLLVFTGAFIELKNKFLYLYIPIGLWFVFSVLILLVDGFLFEINTLNEFGAEVELNPLQYFLYTVLVMGFYILTLLALVANRNKGEKQRQKQIHYLLVAFIITGLLASTTNVWLPWIGIYDYVWLGPLFTASFVTLVSYAIFRHGLFDIKTTVVRSMVYLATIGSVLGIYLLGVVTFTGIDLISNSLSYVQRFSFASLAVISGMLFVPFKAFFDKLTNRIFFQDAYDAQALLDELNQTLVNAVSLEELLTKCALLIQENMKTTYCTFYMPRTSYTGSRIIGAHRHAPEISDIETIEELSKKMHKLVHSAEENTRSDDTKLLNRILRKNNFEVMCKLVSTLDYEVKGIGFMFVGPKRSGQLIDKKDRKLLEIIANELVIATENALRLEEIEKFNVTLQRKIDEATKELKESNDKLRALDEAKDEFVSMASHQLRTPLTSVKGYISMVMEGDAGEISDTQKQMLGQALFSSQRMVYLISDLLNVSRLKTGKFVVEKAPIRLPDVIEDELSLLYDGAGAKNITISYDKPEEFPTLELDAMKIRQVVMNMVDNAIYYTPSGGKITVELKASPKSVEFTVKDTGIGVPKDQQPKMFSKFYRAENARKARPDGTGLGLFMAKKVIIAQGGSMIFHSSEGKGSTFGFSFPRDRLEVKQEN